MPDSRREAASPCPAVARAAGCFAARRLEEAGLGRVAEKIVRCWALDRDDLARLESADVALLGKLVELKRRHAVEAQRVPFDVVARLRGEPLGLDVLRAVAIARLRLPDDVAVAVDASQMDPKLARLAAEFGADAPTEEPIDEEMTAA